MDITAEHNLTPEEMVKALHGISEAEGISEELQKALRRTAVCDDTPKLPQQAAVRYIYETMQAEFGKANADIERYAKSILSR